VENSSASQTSDGSALASAPDGFRVLPTIGLGALIVVVFSMVVMAGAFAWIAQHGLDVSGLARALSGYYGITVQGVAEVAIIALVLWLVPAVAKTSLRGLGFSAPAARDWLVITLGIAGMFLIVTLLASSLTSLLHFKTPELAIALYTHSTGWQKLAFALFGVVLAPIFEESIFRVYLFNAMRKWWGFWWGAIVSAAMFGLAHSQPPFVPAMFLSITLPLAASGVLLAYIYHRTGKAWASMVTHASFNALTLLAVLFFPSLAK
jgi:membrane protease YdiL (CAAX protease family)